MRTIVKAKKPTGFTLIELSVVILIIGILLSLVLAAAASGLESARVRATQALITKLTVGLEERMEAILASQVASNDTHQYLAAIPGNCRLLLNYGKYNITYGRFSWRCRPWLATKQAQFQFCKLS